MGITFASMRTPNGHTCGEAASALQKSIRRGLERESLYWASELDLAGYGAYVWKRLKLIATEDVGLADSNVAVIIRALSENWLEARKKGKEPDRFFLVHAVLVLVRAPKSRLVVHAAVVMYRGERPALEVPDYALDKHTAAGRRMGRGNAHFFAEGAHLENRAELLDEYEAEALAVADQPLHAVSRGNQPELESWEEH